MALTILGTAGPQYANEAAETGINLESFSVKYSPEFRAKLQNYLNQTINIALPTLASRAVTVTGEYLSGATGVMAYTFLTACTVANDIADFGSPAGILLMTEATVSQSRSGWRTVTVTLESDPLLTAVS